MTLRQLLLIAFLLTIQQILLGQNSINFFHLEPKVENENIIVINTVEDKLGYIWMSHKQGIVKYDGYIFLYYPYHIIFKNESLGGVIKKIVIDKDGVLWILNSSGGIAKRLTSGKFVSNIFDFTAHGEPLNIANIFTKNDDIWFTSSERAIYLKKRGSNKIDSITSINKFSHNTLIQDLDITKQNDVIISTNKGSIYKHSIPNNTTEEIKGAFSKYPGIINIVVDESDNLWIGTENLGLFHYSFKKNAIIEHAFFKGEQNLLTYDRFLSLFCDSNGIVWGGSDGEGLYKINPNTGDIKLFKNNLSDKFSLSSNSVIDINEDSNQNLWVVSNYGNLNILPNKQSKIFYHQGSAKKVPVRVLCMLKSTDETLWIGTDGNGLTKVPPFNKKETQELTFEDSNEGFYIQSLVEDKNKNIWIGTYKNGLWFYDNKKETFSKIEITNSNGNTATNIERVFKDSKDRIWVGSNLSIDLFLDKNKKIASFSYSENGLYGDLSSSIIEDSNKNIWMGIDRGGLFKFEESPTNINASLFHRHQHKKVDKNQYPAIMDMTSSNNGKIWLLDSGKLILFDTNNNQFKEFNDFEPFSDAEFVALKSEKNGNLWLSSTQGIWNFNSSDSIVKRYYKTDGFQDDFFIHGSAFRDNLGYMYFGGLYGLNRFHPSTIQKSKIGVNLFVNDIEIVNKPASLVIPEQTKVGIEKVNNLKLDHNQSSFSLRFSVVGNVLNSNYFYSYRLKGFNDNWVISKNERIATYTNIPPGKYTFEVKAGTKKGNWDILSKDIQIHIKQPFWNQTWAYIVYLLMAGAIAYAIFRWIILKNKLHSERVKSNYEKEIYALKMNFFAKMSHEIQTPLTLIKAPIDDMLKRIEGSGNLLLGQRLKMIANNTNRLSRITNELTTIRNRELGQLKLKTQHKDIVKELRQITESFEEHARFKHIDLYQNHNEASYDLWFDSDKIEHIIYNLFSNAFKFTPREGKITLISRVNYKRQMFEISIEDTGPGISKEEQENIFKLFYQTKKGERVKGTGIGLALVKELVHLHKGEISIGSKKEQGSKFTVLLPIDEEVYSKKEKIDLLPESEETVQEDSQFPMELLNDIKSQKGKHTLLIVEDNFEMQYLLQDVFGKYYKIVIAENGKEGIALAKEHIPSLIVSDISMPIMNGLEMCKILHKEEKTSHIPIILLTARNTIKTRIKGLKYGAVEFINKPFDINELQLKIHNIIFTQEKAITNLKSEIISTPKGENIKSQDTLFLEKLVGALNKELGNSDFKLESLSEVFNMSYSAIYRKCQALTGKTVVDFFRLIRLKKAAILIVKNGYSVSETSYLVGFNDAKYFSKCFKTHFKKSPNAFKKEAKTSDLDAFLKTHSLNDEFEDIL